MRDPDMAVDVPKVGDQFKSEVGGVPVLLEVVKVVEVTADGREALLKTRLVRRLVNGEMN